MAVAYSSTLKPVASGVRVGGSAAVNGLLRPIYPGEPGVVPYVNAAQNRTYVPIRFIGEALGAEVQWNAPNRTVTIVKGELTVVMTVGSSSYTLNGQPQTMDAAAEIDQNRTMVPIRFVSQALGSAVEWDASNRLVLIAPAGAPWNMQNEVDRQAVADTVTMLALGPMFL